MDHSTATSKSTPESSERLRKNRLTFFLEFLRHPLQVGSVIPSSRFLEQRILSAAGVSDAETVVELGSGTGGTTQAILNLLPPHGKLLSLDINPRFHELVRSIDDQRLIAHLGSAVDIVEILRMHGLARVDAVISGIPFSTMSPDLGLSIVEAVDASLKPQGRFVAYQASNRVHRVTQPVLGQGSVSLELLSIPPMRVYRWAK